MWKGLGQKLKDIAEDLTTPPFIDEEDEEDEVEQGLDKARLRHTQPQPVSFPQAIAHHHSDDEDDMYDDSEGPVHDTRASVFTGAAASPRATGAAPPVATVEGQQEHALTVPPLAQQLQPRPLASLQSHFDAPPPAQSPPSTMEGFPRRRLVEELNLATPETSTIAGHSLRTSLPESIQATLHSTPAAAASTAGTSTTPVTRTAERKEPVVSTPSPQLADSSDFIQTLQKRVRDLESEKTKLTQSIDVYQEEVKKAHEETVAYYSEEIKKLQDVIAARDAEVKALNAKVARLENAEREREKKLVAAESAAQEEEHRVTKEMNARLEKELTSLREEAQQREAAFVEQRSVLEAQITELLATREETTGSTDAAQVGASTVSLEEHTHVHALEEQVQQLQAEVASLTQRLQDTHESLNSTGKDQQPLGTSSSPSVAQPGASCMTQEPHASPDSLAPSQQQSDAASHLVKLVAAKDMEVQNLKKQLDALHAAHAQREAELNQLSEGYISLDEMLEQERSAHKEYVHEQQEALSQSVEKMSRNEARVVELERLLEDKEEELEHLRRAHAAETASRPPTDTITAADVQQSKEGIARLESEKATLTEELATQRKTLTQKENELQLLQKSLANTQAAVEDARKATESERKRLQETHDAELQECTAQWQARLDEAVRLVKAEAAAAAAAATVTSHVDLEHTANEHATDHAALQAELDALREETVTLKQHLSTMAKKTDALENSLQAAEAEREHLRQTCAQVEKERNSAQEQLSHAEATLQKERDARRVEDRVRQQSEGASAEALQKRVAELEKECDRTDDVLEELQRNVIECLTRNHHTSASGGSGAPSSTGSSAEGTFYLDLYDVKASKKYSFSDWILTLTTALDKTAGMARKAGRVQAEWERTYEEARQVNETLNQQLSDAWGTIGHLQEDLSVKEETLRETQQQMRTREEVIADLEQRLVRVTNELAELQEDGVFTSGGGNFAKASQETGDSGGVGATPPGASRQRPSDALVVELQSEVQSLRLALQQRDDELTMAQRSVENVSEVLESFKASRANDIAERTMDLQLEIEQLREQLASGTHVRDDFQKELDAQRAVFERDLVSKNAEITALHRKLAELRKALENAAKQLNGESSIDKGVVSHILVNFIHGFVGQRKETDEILKILSGLLGWDEEMQERVGLLPGPLNPQPPLSAQGGGGGTNGGKRGGLLSWVRGGGGGSNKASSSTNGHSANPSKSSTAPASQAGESLASMWVDFLMRESEQRAASTSGSAPDAALEQTTATAPLETTDGPPPPPSLTHAVSSVTEATEST